MASSDDEGEAVPNIVSNYHFVDDKDEPISFSELPVQWNDSEGLDRNTKQIFLHGTTDNGLQKIYKQVKAWKFDLSDAKPEILVLAKESSWMRLQKPRKSFEDTIRSILITVHCLHFVKKNPEMSGKLLWDQLSKVFSSYETRPSENDLIDQMTLICEAIEKDEILAKSKFLVTFVEEKPRKKKAFDENIGSTKPGFIVPDDVIDEIEDDDDEEDDLFDSVCAICDNGGDILCCEGRCMRSFHATEEAGSDSTCESLGFSTGQVDAIQDFFCKNCQYKQHQCFSCGELGSSDKLSGAEVFPCVSATCGRFYHPHCVAKLLHRESAAEAEVIQKKIAAGESFTCPIHKCIVCKQGEYKMDPDLQFAICRRCPKSYHRKCLPRKIAFEDNEDEGIIQRAWEGLIPNRILIYCLKHEIDDDIGTPIRNHLKFPDDGQKKKKQASEHLARKEKVLQNERTLASADASRKRTLGKLQKGVDLPSMDAEGVSSKKIVRRLTGPDSSKKQQVRDTYRKPLKSTASAKVMKSTDGPSLGERLYNLYSKGSESFKLRKDTPDGEHTQTLTDNPVPKEKSDSHLLDDDSKRRILALVKDAASSLTLENITKQSKGLMTHAYSSRNVVDKALTLGKVEGSVEAMRAALQKLEEGCSVEDAKAVCQPEVLNQMLKWKNKLKVYLAPFLYGMRYTSFGRHFTKVDKLKEIVDVLHCYVKDGDMIVDFCCGSNDFSCLMKKKLDQTGIKCSYKNYDLLQAKNDFNFEKRDWMRVHPKELPAGSQLIMGLNPPFGVNAGLANKFINKALEFKPKLLILIVPRETERLDKKDPPYDLVWEDGELLSGKSFYLPGSVDVNDNQMEDWNVNPPPLYLWSRADWTAIHKAIAQQHGHLSRVHKRPSVEEHNETLVSDYPMEVYDPNNQSPVSMELSIDDPPVQNEVQVHKQPHESGANVSGSLKEGFPCDNYDREACKVSSHEKNILKRSSRKRRRGKGKHGRESIKPSPEIKERGQSSVGERYDSMPRLSPPNVARGRSLDHLTSEPREAPSHTEVGEEGRHQFEHVRSHYQTGYSGTPRADDDIARRYSLNIEEPYSGGTHRWSSGTSPGPGPDYGVRNSGEQFPGYNRSYINEIEQRYTMESAVRSQMPIYRQQQYPDAFGQRSSYFGGGDPGVSSSYGHRVPAPSTSAMQRYAPRLDELNHTRMNTSGSVPQPTAGRNGIPNPLAPQPGYQVDSMGFAPGPYHPFSQQNSSGWLND
ncbi:LOW QUALITY PROTEIN: protein ENHANCED DOWNY MILDEW 2-like [Actinidia eriantha]|uniref:LOW QUALITY PROTEIN: protein ENHANCED DOWNY MILDEW 2-like n=1 Tax=Actinidia eriantha TaxID=165200 RepID=UPI00258916C7|nr:LOW QUALITY PROTEIN: protein ENHANCED DOWNY MILDEW 2-like [Actinidia eriantha]